MMNVYLELMKLLRTSKEDSSKDTTMLESDIDILRQAGKYKLSDEMRMAILFRIE